MKRIKKIIYCLLSLGLTVSSYATVTNTKKVYCEPTNLTKYEPSPIVFDNYKSVASSLSIGYNLGHEINTVINGLSKSPINMFYLTNSALASISDYIWKFSNNSDKNSNEITPIVTGSLTKGYTILNNDKLTTQLSNNILYPVAIAPTSSTPEFLAISSGKQNLVAATASESSNSNSNTPDYNTIKKDFLCNKDISSSGLSSNISKMYMHSYTMEKQISNCNDVLNTNNNSKSNIVANNTTCSAEIGACELVSYQINTVPYIQRLLVDFNKSYPSEAELITSISSYLNKIKLYDLSKYTGSANAYTAICTNAQSCTADTCYTTNNVTSDASTLLQNITEINKKLKIMQNIDVNSAINNCTIAKNKSKNTSSSNSDDILYSQGSGFDILMSSESFGKIDPNNPFACSIKTEDSDKQKIALSFIDKMGSLFTPPSYFIPNVGVDEGIVLATGAFSDITSSSGISSYVEVENIITSREKNEKKIAAIASDYEVQLKQFLAAKNIAMSNLYFLYSERNNTMKIPVIKPGFSYNPKCIDGYNNASSNDPSCKFKAPYSNINQLWTTLAGQTCSDLEIKKREATWRSQLVLSDTQSGEQNLNAWQQQINFDSENDVLRNKLFLLADIKKQLFQNKLLKERVLATISSMQINSLDESKKSIIKLKENIDRIANEYIEGGNSSS